MHTTTFDAYEAASWEDRAAAYADFLVPITGRIADTLLEAAAVRLNTRAIDIATGPGQIAAACAARGAKVLGVDIAQEMVALARRRYPELEFMRTDAHRLPLPDASMDAVVGNFAILHLGQPDQAVAEFARVLAPGGRLALSTWDVPERARFIGVFVDAVAAAGAVAPPSIPDGPAFFQFADQERFADLLSGAGLVDVTVRTVAFTHRFTDADDLWDGILGATVRIRDMVLGQPAGVQSKIRATYDELIAGYVSADGGLEMPVSVKVASGRKGTVQ